MDAEADVSRVRLPSDVVPLDAADIVSAVRAGRNNEACEQPTSQCGEYPQSWAQALARLDTIIIRYSIGALVWRLGRNFYLCP